MAKTEFEIKLEEFHELFHGAEPIDLAVLLRKQAELKRVEMKRTVTKLEGGCVLIKLDRWHKKKRQAKGAKGGE